MITHSLKSNFGEKDQRTLHSPKPGWFRSSQRRGHCTTPWQSSGKNTIKKGQKLQPPRNEVGESVENSFASTEVRKKGGRGRGAPGNQSKIAL